VGADQLSPRLPEHANANVLIRITAAAAGSGQELDVEPGDGFRRRSSLVMRSKTRPTNYDRAETLERILTWMHLSGAASYDPAAHAAGDPAALLLVR